MGYYGNDVRIRYPYESTYAKDMKRQQIYKEYLDYQSPFSHYFACWANNHNGWRKMKKTNKKRAKKRWRDAWRKEAQEYER